MRTYTHKHVPGWHSYNAVEVVVKTPGGSKSTGSIPACAFSRMQNGMARGQWNFSGYIVSDCGAIADFLVLNDCSGCEGQFPGGDPVTGKYLPCHGLCTDANMTSQCPACSSKCIFEKMFAGGTDSACGGEGDKDGATRAGGTTKAQLVASSQRILRVMISLGLINPPDKQPYAHLGKADVATDATRQLNLEAARQSIVLVKNDPAWDEGERALPIKPGMTVAAIGPHAKATAAMCSSYGPPLPKDTSKARVVSPYEALLAAGFNTTYAPGAGIGFVATPVWLDEAEKLAERVDVAVVFVGLDAGQEHESGDRNATGYGLKLPGDQQELVRRVQQANARTVVVLIHGSPVAIEYAKAHVPAIVDAHYPGAMGGLAIADVLTGAYNPSGRLVTTVYPQSFVNRSIADTGLRSDGGLTYMHYDGSYGEPLWEFGHGLSYSNFTAKPYGHPPPSTATTASLAAGGIAFSVQVTNNGGPEGAFSALGFVNSSHPEAPRNRKLFDYDRASIGVNTSAVLTVHLTAANGGLVEADGTLCVLPGVYHISVADVGFQLTLTGPRVVVTTAPPLFD